MQIIEPYLLHSLAQAKRKYKQQRKNESKPKAWVENHKQKKTSLNRRVKCLLNSPYVVSDAKDYECMGRNENYRN